MANSYKAIAVAAQLFDSLKLRCTAAGLACTQSTDTDGNPLIVVGAGTSGTQSATIKILPQPWPLAKDVLGNTALQYVPTQAQVVTESSTTSLVAATILTPKTIGLVLGELLARGLRTDWYEVANGTAPGVAGITGAPAMTFDPSLQYPLTGAGQ